MIKYSIKRLLWTIPVILGVLFIVFFFQAVSPDDPVDQILKSGATEEEKAAVREQLGLDKPIPTQFVNYVWGFATRGDLGTSYINKQPITQELMTRFPVTIKLTFFSILLGIAIGIPLGLIASIKQYSLIDSAILAFSVLSSSVPGFWFGLMLISLFAVKLGWLPAMGILTWKGWILPTLAVSVVSMSGLIRITRTSMLEVIRQDYIRTAKAKGQRLSVIAIRHGLRNALIPIISNVGNSLGLQLGGALAIESIFGVPGIGKYAVDGITNRNYPAVLGSVVILAIVFIIVNLLVDLAYTVVDPRVKTAFAQSAVLKNKRLT